MDDNIMNFRSGEVVKFSWKKCTILYQIEWQKINLGCGNFVRYFFQSLPRKISVDSKKKDDLKPTIK